MRQRLAWLVILALGAAACGSTAEVSRVAGPGGAGVGAADAGLQATGSVAQSGNGGAPGAGGSAITGGPTGLSAPVDSATLGPDSSATAAATGPVPVRPSAPILLGYSTAKDLSSTAGSVGITGGDPGDMTAQMNGIVSYVNRGGGLLGHKIALVDYDENFMQAAVDPAATEQAACTAWTEDAHVFAALDTIQVGSQDNTLQDCLASHQTPLIVANGDGDGTPQTFSRPYGPFSPDGMRVDRYLPAFIGRLVADQFFAGWNTATGSPGPAPVRIGLMHFDDPGGNAYAASIKRALAARGMHVTDEASWPDGPQNASSGASAAVLKFRSDGITHVFGANIVFYHTAESQKYYPRYGIDDGIDTVALLAQQAGIAKELHGSMGAGFMPASEVPNPPDSTPATTRCKQIMDAAGQTYWRTNSFAIITMEGECDDVFLLVAAVQRAGILSPAGVLSGINSLGAAFQPAMTYRSSLGPDAHDGAAGVRDYAYNDQCGCFGFLSPDVYPA